ncbi:unnamed protein product [Psylliodes chrysocephalus]|uniref:HAT C-terminal dimerisation domain-containing protein n=1 Tax=Psylliodes chrysocephalus TaxID=3402493 RepID=A0A9P0CY10_9CUCU|nr:unnamed protein product [Psylliodes chrysocephala]
MPLIDLYRDRPVMWNCRLKEYKDRNKRHDAVIEIAVSFGVEKEEVERKLKNLIYTLSVQLAGRKSAYEKLYENFNFFDDLSEIDTNELKNLANKLVTKYPDDLEETLGNECIHLHCQLKDSLANMEDVRSAQKICNVLHSWSLRDVYPNVDIALRIFLSIPATNCSGERSFSTLKRVKTYLRASIGQDRLNALALLSIEAQLVQEINYDDIIDVFARNKARKKKFSN